MDETPRTILVAEDDPGVRFTLQVLLEDEGFDVILASDGHHALAAARERRPDLILLDQMMPRMGGREVFRALRGETGTSDIPVLVLTGLGPVSPEEWPGAHFVGKPFDPDSLVARINGALGR